MRNSVQFAGTFILAVLLSVLGNPPRHAHSKRSVSETTGPAPMIDRVSPSPAPWAGDSFVFVTGSRLGSATWSANGVPVSARPIGANLVALLLPAQGLASAVTLQANGAGGTVEITLPLGGTITPAGADSYVEGLRSVLSAAAESGEITQPGAIHSLLSPLRLMGIYLGAGDFDRAIDAFLRAEDRLNGLIGRGVVSAPLSTELADVFRFTFSGLMANVVLQDNEDDLFRNCTMSVDEVRNTIRTILLFVELRIQKGENLGHVKLRLQAALELLLSRPPNVAASKAAVADAMRLLNFKVFVDIFVEIAKLAGEGVLDAIISKLIPQIGLAKAISALSKILKILSQLKKFKRFADKIAKILDLLKKAEEAAKTLKKLQDVADKLEAALTLERQLAERIAKLAALIDAMGSENPPTAPEIEKAIEDVEKTLEEIKKLAS